MAGIPKWHVHGAQTLERSYLLRINDTVVERPQHMLMRVAIGIHKQVRLKDAVMGEPLKVHLPNPYITGRVNIMAITEQDIDSAVQTYHYLSERWFTHASPTLFNAGTPRPQLSSCFLLAMKNDSIEVGYQQMSIAGIGPGFLSS